MLSISTILTSSTGCSGCPLNEQNKHLCTKKEVRNHGAPVTNHDLPTDCSKNYYSQEFVSNLSNRAYHVLKMRLERELGIID
jgi:hypothetical protein